jgi:tetratricopeptide (TPR) repeat protein
MMAMKRKSQATDTSMIPPSKRSLNARMIQNFHLVWLDEGIDKDNDEECRNSIRKLQEVVNTVNTFNNIDECMDFITNVKETETFMIISPVFSRTIVPIVQNIAQVSSVYLFCPNKEPHELWANEWSKVKSVCTDITQVCEALKHDARKCDQNSVSINFVKLTEETSNENRDTLDPSFMYTQILKEILLTVDFKQEHFDEFLAYCREQYATNDDELKNVEKFKEYCDHQPIWWYTYLRFLYTMLNRALRLMEIDVIIKVGFFLRDLHHNIAALHAEQYGKHSVSDPFIVYRGQVIAHADFDRLTKTEGGLISFNNFLSTTHDQAVALMLADSNGANPDMVGVLFKITIIPSKSSSPFANLEGASHYDDEKEILFSMHSIFRMEQMKQIDGNDRLWQLDLTLTNENDRELNALTEFMREETKGSTGWHRLGQLMIKLGQFNKAEELYRILLKQTTDKNEKAHLCHQLGWAKAGQGRYRKAAKFYHKSIKIKRKTSSSTHLHLANSYNNLGNVYENMGKYSTALRYHKKALEIYQTTNHSALAASYTSQGSVYEKMGEYSTALVYHEKALEVKQKTFLANHPDLVTSYNNIGSVYTNMGEYLKALSNYEKVLEILPKTLPEDHPHLATAYNNIGGVYQQMGEYLKALSYYQKAVDIYQKIVRADHPDWATVYNNIGLLHDNLGEYSKALSFHEKALEIGQKQLSGHHPSLAAIYNSIGLVYNKMGEYSKALSHYEKAHEILSKNFSSNHLRLATSYNNIGTVYNKLGEYSKARTYFEKDLEISEKTLPLNYPYLATSYNNIGEAHKQMGEYSKAVSYYEKALEIQEKTLPANHPDLASSFNNIGVVFDKMDEYSKALLYHEKALKIKQKMLPSDHPHLATSYNNIGMVYNRLGEYSKALTYFEKDLEIQQKVFPANQSLLATTYYNIGLVYHAMAEYSKALSYCERALDIKERSLPADHPSIEKVKKTIEIIKKKL